MDYFSPAAFPAAISLSRAICAQVRLRTAVIPVPPRRASSSKESGGNPAVPSSEFTSARFSARNRSTSASSASTYRDRKCKEIHEIMFFDIRFMTSVKASELSSEKIQQTSGAGFSLWGLVTATNNPPPQSSPTIHTASPDAFEPRETKRSPQPQIPPAKASATQTLPAAPIASVPHSQVIPCHV